MATEYAFVDDSGTTRLEGFLVPEPGGSSPFTGWTGDASDPANVNSNGGNLTVPGFLTATGGVEMDAADGDGPFFQSYSQDGPNYLTLGGTGDVSMAVSIMHGGGVMMAHLPTSDPALAGALWVDASADFALKVSQG